MILALAWRLPVAPAGAAVDNLAQPDGAAAQMPRVAVEPQTHDGTSLYATRYRVVRGDCTIAWLAYNNEPGVVKHEADCQATLREQLPLLRAACAAFLAGDRNAPAFRTLFLGTLASERRHGSREMSFRLAVAAYRSSGWDRTLGRPKHGDLNGFVRDLANQAMIYPELSELLAGFGRTVTLSHIEKVLVRRADQLPDFPALEKLGVRAGDRLPFDCMVWFAVTTADGT